MALGTVADVVPLDTNNRIFDWQGLKPHSGQVPSELRRCWKSPTAIRLLAASDLGFALGPRLNAAGRLDDMSVGVALLLCDNIGKTRASGQRARRVEPDP